MRLLFSHGLTGAELFRGIDTRTMGKDYAWLSKNLGFYRRTAEDYYGTIFNYCFKLIVEYIIENKVRFTSPFSMFYIDYEIFMEDEFLKHRQIGRLQDIDIVQSDFTGYQLSVFYKAYRNDSLYKKRNLYLGPQHKELLLEKINSGEKLYTIKNVKLDYFIPLVKKEFKKLSLKDINKILSSGMMRMYYALKFQCYLSLQSYKYKTKFFIGNIYFNKEDQINDFFFRTRMKYQKLYAWDGCEFDGYHYIGIDINQMKDWAKKNFRKENHGWKFLYVERVMARRQLDVVRYNSLDIFIFKIKLKKKWQKRWNYYIRDEKFRDAEYVGRAINYQFTPSDIHWKELLKEYYEKSDS